MFTTITPIPNNSIETISDKVSQIYQNTGLWSGNGQWVITIITILASIATILGSINILRIYREKKVNKDYWRKLIVDLIRHLFINNAIIETIRIKCEGKYNEKHPAEGVFQRFKTLDEDLQLGRFSYNARYYELIHKICIRIRNYNIAAMAAESHFANKDYPEAEKVLALYDIYKRSVDIAADLIELSNKLNCNLSSSVLNSYMTSKYGNGYISKEEKRFDSNLVINEIIFCFDKDINEHLIKYRSKLIEQVGTAFCSNLFIWNRERRSNLRHSKKELRHYLRHWQQPLDFHHLFENAIRYQSRKFRIVDYF